MEELGCNHQKEDLNVKKNRLSIDAPSFLSLIKQSYGRKYSQKIVSLQNDLCQKKRAFKLHHRNLSRNTPKNFFNSYWLHWLGGILEFFPASTATVLKRDSNTGFFP